MYEVTMLVYVAAEIGNQPDEASPSGNALLESFAVHARCLDHFLWRDRDRKPRDAFATDFCGPGDWERERDGLKRRRWTRCKLERFIGQRPCDLARFPQTKPGVQAPHFILDRRASRGGTRSLHVEPK